MYECKGRGDVRLGWGRHHGVTMVTWIFEVVFFLPPFLQLDPLSSPSASGPLAHSFWCMKYFYLWRRTLIQSQTQCYFWLHSSLLLLLRLSAGLILTCVREIWGKHSVVVCDRSVENCQIVSRTHSHNKQMVKEAAGNNKSIMSTQHGKYVGTNKEFNIYIF